MPTGMSPSARLQMLEQLSLDTFSVFLKGPGSVLQSCRPESLQGGLCRMAAYLQTCNPDFQLALLCLQSHSFLAPDLQPLMCKLSRSAVSMCTPTGHDTPAKLEVRKPHGHANIERHCCIACNNAICQAAELTKESIACRCKHAVVSPSRSQASDITGSWCGFWQEYTSMFLSFSSRSSFSVGAFADAGAGSCIHNHSAAQLIIASSRCAVQPSV